MLLRPTFLMKKAARMSMIEQELYYNEMLYDPPNNTQPLPYIQRAQTRIALEKYYDAIADIKFALVLIPPEQLRNRNFCFGLLGFAYLSLMLKTNDHGMIDGTIEALTAAVEGGINPYSGIYSLSRSVAYLRKFQFSRAGDDLINALRINSQSNSEMFTTLVDTMLDQFLGRTAEFLLQGNCPEHVVAHIKNYLQQTAAQPEPVGLFARFFNTTDKYKIKLCQFYLALINDSDNLTPQNVSFKTLFLLKAAEQNLSPECIRLSGYDWHVIEYQDSISINSSNFAKALEYYNYFIPVYNADVLAPMYMLRGIANMKFGDSYAAESDFTLALELLPQEQQHERAICFANHGRITSDVDELGAALDLGGEAFNAEERAVIHCHLAECFITCASESIDTTEVNKYLKTASEHIITAANTSQYISPLLRKLLFDLFDINFCATAELMLRGDSPQLVCDIVQELLIKTADEEASDLPTIELHQFYLRLYIARDSLFTNARNHEVVIIAEAENQRLSHDAVSIMNINLNTERNLTGLVLRV